MKFNRRQTVTLLAAASATPWLGLSAFTAGKADANARQASQPLSPEQAREIAREVFLWGMHPVALYHMRYNIAQNQKSPRYVLRSCPLLSVKLGRDNKRY